MLANVTCYVIGVFVIVELSHKGFPISLTVACIGSALILIVFVLVVVFLARTSRKRLKKGNYLAAFGHLVRLA